ncbi:transposable element Tcb1 transposase [Trichonephila clavipes]|nr:transposable element Tcb1 transposase [Trichonephila clavipes]
MDWSVYSPDLNPIEHVWDMLGRRIAARQQPPTCLPELQRALIDVSGVIFPKISVNLWVLFCSCSHCELKIIADRVLSHCLFHTFYGTFLKIKNILRCYKIKIHRPVVSTFHDPVFPRHPSLLPHSDLSPSVLARSFSLYRLSFDLLPGAGSGSLHAPPKSKICPLWLILPYQTPGIENSQTVKQKIHKQNTQ